MKISNMLSASRLILAPIFFILFFLPMWFNVDSKIVICILIPIFIFLELTDFLDGYFARKFEEVSDFGKHFDPFCDALGNITIMLCFMLAGYIHPLMFILILYREFSITFLRMNAIKNNFVIQAKMGGKVKTVFYILSMGFSLFIEMYKTFFDFSTSTLNTMWWINFIMYSIAIILSITTFIDYFINYRKILKLNKTKDTSK